MRFMSTIAAVLAVGSARADYQDKCDTSASFIGFLKNNAGGESPYLGTRCNAADGSSKKTKVILNNCLGSLDGKLIWERAGRALEYCDHCQFLSGPDQELVCFCYVPGLWPGEKTRKVARISMTKNSEIFVTDGGMLACFDIVGTEGW